ncbi:alpha/beta-hydrolase [Sarocladium strictum]
MIDHVLGRPSSKSRRMQVLAVLSFWGFYLYKGHRHGPPGTKPISRLLSARLTTWQTVVITMMYLYAARNFSALAGLASPEPMANMYDPTFFRATWVLTALDAGFWTAMKIRAKWLRDLASIAFSVFYLFAAERADEKVRKVRGMLTVEHLRVSWNKGTTPYLQFFQGLMRPRFTRWPPRQVRIPRPSSSDYKDHVSAWLYFDGPLSALSNQNKLILDVPGGGFVAMDPRCNDDKLLAWAAKSGLPVLSIDYRKAPEYPYPFALNECFDVYSTIHQTRGRCIGMSGNQIPRVIITGDSAGGNLAVATTLMILESSSATRQRLSSRGEVPAPDGLVCFYPALDMNIGNWMTDEQMALIRDRKMRKTNKSIVKRKSMQYNQLAGTPHHSEDEEEPSATTAQKSSKPNETSSPGSKSQEPIEAPIQNGKAKADHTNGGSPNAKQSLSGSHHSEALSTRLATSSIISYFNDRVLTPELMRAMIILYIGPHNRPDFTKDYLLSPVLAPDELLVKFPKTFFMTGERDPLVDDTVIFAGRLRRAKEAMVQKEAESSSSRFSQYSSAGRYDAPEVLLIPGTSHGFMQFPSVYPPAWKHFDRCASWFELIFANAESQRKRERTEQARAKAAAAKGAESSEEDRPLEMSMTRVRSGSGGGKDGHEGKRGNGSAKKGKMLSKSKSLVKLSSEDDLLGRRMEGLTSGLTGMVEEE